MNYLTDKVFHTYFSGVPNGSIIFREKKAVMCAIDRRTRVQLKEAPILPREEGRAIAETMIDYEKLFRELDAYVGCAWDQDEMTLKNGAVYSRHITYTGTVEGKTVTAQLWCQRKSHGCMDILTVDQKIIGFINPGRICSEITVLAGYESVTPLTRFDDPLLSKVAYGVNPLGNIMVPCKDGVRLATEVFLPKGLEPGQKVPSIVIRTCYGKARDIDRSWHWVTRGYAFVIQDVRGRSDSDGTLEAFQHEREDADDLFNWIAAQPWSDGNIGMWGASYLGYTTTSACTSGNPHLKTAVSEVNVGSPFYDTVRKGGTVCSWPLLCWTLAQSVSNRVDMDVFKGVSIDPLEAVRIRPITAIPEKIIGCRSTSWDMWSKHYHYDDFWRHSDNTAHADNIRIPMLILSGWYDGDALGVQETWRFLSKSPVPGHRIVLGPWPHGLNAWRDSMDLAFGNNAVDYDFDTRIIRWFDHYLKGIENGEDKKPKATYYVNGENQWHTSEDWMPKEARLVNLYLDSDGHANSMNGDGRVTLRPAATHLSTIPNFHAAARATASTTVWFLLTSAIPVRSAATFWSMTRPCWSRILPLPARCMPSFTQPPAPSTRILSSASVMWTSRGLPVMSASILSAPSSARAGTSLSCSRRGKLKNMRWRCISTAWFSKRATRSVSISPPVS